MKWIQVDLYQDILYSLQMYHNPRKLIHAAILILLLGSSSILPQVTILYERAQYLQQNKRYLEAANIFDQVINNEESSKQPDQELLTSAYLGAGNSYRLAGANSVSVSLWPIADEATSEFMVSVYTKIADGEDYSDAISDTKKEFISGLYGEEYKHPFYWAPFVYYGK